MVYHLPTHYVKENPEEYERIRQRKRRQCLNDRKNSLLFVSFVGLSVGYMPGRGIVARLSTPFSTHRASSNLVATSHPSPCA
ncbi:hypothetical protein K402DRAFT_60989 [Aulographum hederae CBS 113979]|uniref:Uncharacterized protein n=1 Tax=Aulographum hederae CBS 113979 TaxID=1176131 RepID=A0A6G1H1A3_9PEZI|nr:hypothetical protein K402DRAFT_60989 [Aulographum hederae CBS 113979]